MSQRWALSVVMALVVWPATGCNRGQLLDSDEAAESRRVGAGSQPQPQYALFQNYPNPFDVTTTIAFSVGNTGPVKLTVYNVNGGVVRILVNETKDEGAYSEDWDGTDSEGRPAGPGTYFYELVTEGFSDSKKMMLAR